jgi:hypothetical protein
VIQGALGSINDVGPFFKKILQLLASQQPEELTIELSIRTPQFLWGILVP